MSDLFRCDCERSGSCSKISACYASGIARDALDEQQQKFEEQIEILRADLAVVQAEYTAAEHLLSRCAQLLGAEDHSEVPGLIERLRAELTTAEAALESLQNKWASRPLSVEDTAALERENDALRADAERYRWLRGDAEQHSERWMRWELRRWDGQSWHSLEKTALGAAIDAALAEEQQP